MTYVTKSKSKGSVFKAFVPEQLSLFQEQTSLYSHFQTIVIYGLEKRIVKEVGNFGIIVDT